MGSVLGGLLYLVGVVMVIWSGVYCYRVAQRHNMNKIIAALAGALIWPLGIVLYSHLNYKLNKKKVDEIPPKL